MSQETHLSERGVGCEADELSFLIGEIYDAALEPEKWRSALSHTAGFVGGVASAIFWKDSVNKRGDALYTWGYDPAFSESYFARYIKMDPFTVAQFFSDPGELTCIADLLPREEFHRTVFYNEWVRPQGWLDALGVVLEKSHTSYAGASVIRHERDGVVDDEARRKMKLIVPHLRRAVLIGKVVKLKTTEAEMLADSLDGLASAMFAVDAAGRIVHANAAAHALLDRADPFRRASGKLVPVDPVADQALRDVFEKIPMGDSATGSRGIAVPIPSADGLRYVAHVLPLTSGERRRAGAAYSAVAAVFVQKAALEMPSTPELIATTYKLTPTELRVLLEVVEIGGVADVSRALGISEATVKTHLQRVFAKTGARRQAELVKIAAGFKSPLH